MDRVDISSFIRIPQRLEETEIKIAILALSYMRDMSKKAKVLPRVDIQRKPTIKELNNPSPTSKGKWLEDLLDWAFQRAVRGSLLSYIPVKKLPRRYPFMLEGRLTEETPK